jgi:hypothetical protein
MHDNLTSYADFDADSLLHTEHTDRSLVKLGECTGLQSLEALDLTDCAALVKANLAGCESLQTVHFGGCTGLRELQLPR